MTQIRHAVDPKPVRTELKNAAVLFFLDQRQPERVPIEGDSLLIGMAWTFDCNVRSTGKLRPIEFSNHRSSLAAFRSAATCRRFKSADMSALSKCPILHDSIHSIAPYSVTPLLARPARSS